MEHLDGQTSIITKVTKARTPMKWNPAGAFFASCLKSWTSAKLDLMTILEESGHLNVSDRDKMISSVADRYITPEYLAPLPTSVRTTTAAALHSCFYSLYCLLLRCCWSIKVWLLVMTADVFYDWSIFIVFNKCTRKQLLRFCCGGGRIIQSFQRRLYAAAAAAADADEQSKFSLQIMDFGL